MNLLGILRASALFILISAFHGQPASCGIFSRILSSKKPSSVDVSEISENPKESAVESSSQESNPSSQSNLVFESSTWDDSKLASAVLFLEQFCRDVRAEKFNVKISDANMKGLLEVCTGILCHVRPLASHVPTSSALWNLYKDALKSDKFKDYAEWLVKHLEGIRISVGKLHNETRKYSVNQLKTDKSDVLSKCGFVCNGDPNGEILHRWPSLEYRAQLFMRELEHLEKCMGNILKSSPKNSTVKSKAV
ncbi:secreted antigen 1 [Babesia divergens]|uniref:Secreted antigen 1 n=1 Tax=Babesia divergens TaxID=32595 RepID=A0AAD9GAF3_BABDI|nr:secreted antigen 1 [Babesia divergens]